MDTLLDALKLLPFLFVTFLVIECIEHKLDGDVIAKAGRLGPLWGSLLGVIPQCGFSASATNLYATRIISLGTLISVYLSTSDEMIPIMLANKVDVGIIVRILLFKFFIGMVVGFVVDLLFRRREKLKIDVLCKHDHCDCEHSIVFSALKHTMSIVLFVLVSTFVINLVFEYLGQGFLERFFMKNTIFSHMLASLVGLIPNCGSSIMITELFLNNTITFGALLSGLLSGSGIGILLLFKTNKSLSENLLVLSLIYVIGVLSGFLVDLLGVF